MHCFSMSSIIQSLWIGDSLSLMEQLTIKSFIDNGHIFHLYSYSKHIENLPNQAILKDANDIIPECEVYTYDGNGDCRKGSLGCGFTDLFRYKLIYEKGGWYVDLDVTCLRNFDEITLDYVFRPHIKYKAVSNILKAPAGSEFILDCYNDIKNKINKNNDRWERVIEIFCDNIIKHELEHYIVDKLWFGNDNWEEIYRYFDFINDSYEMFAIHWMNEAFKHRGVYIAGKDYKVDYHKPLDYTVYCDVLQKHELINETDIVKNDKHIINGLWVGKTISLMTVLTIKSFIDCHNTYFILWCYSPDEMKEALNEFILNGDDQLIKSSLVIKDAGQIIPEEKVFCYTGNGDCRAGSYGGFSDLFRYELLYKRGGWYVDMDVTCIKDFRDFKDDYVIRPHHQTEIVGNILKVPKNSDWMKLCKDDAWEQINENNNDWHKPIEILRKNFYKCNLEKYVVDKNYFGNDGIDNFNIVTAFYHHMFFPNKNDYNLKLEHECKDLQYFNFNVEFASLFEYALHWMNEASSNGLYRERVDWDKPKPKSMYTTYLKHFKIYNNYLCR